MDLEPATRVRASWQCRAIGSKKTEPCGNSDRRISKKFELVTVCLVNKNFNPAKLSDTPSVKTITEADHENIVNRRDWQGRVRKVFVFIGVCNASYAIMRTEPW